MMSDTSRVVNTRKLTPFELTYTELTPSRLTYTSFKIWQVRSSYFSLPIRHRTLHGVEIRHMLQVQTWIKTWLTEFQTMHQRRKYETSTSSHMIDFISSPVKDLKFEDVFTLEIYKEANSQ